MWLLFAKVWQDSSLVVWSVGSLAVWQFGSLAVWQFGSLAVWQFGKRRTSPERVYARHDGKPSKNLSCLGVLRIAPSQRTRCDAGAVVLRPVLWFVAVVA